MKRVNCIRQTVVAAFVVAEISFTGCKRTQKNTTTMTAEIREEAPPSDYVTANSDDQNNNGRSEKTPFKTLSRAIEVAEQGAIKRITVIGTLNATSEENMGWLAVFTIDYNGKDELIIAGKANAARRERTVLSAAGTYDWSWNKSNKQSHCK